MIAAQITPQDRQLPLVVINPNSTVAVTDGIDAAMEPFRQVPDSPEIHCFTLAEGPPGVESQRHVEQVVSPLLSLIEQHQNSASAFVIACYSDPGLHAAREVSAAPVFGIAECGLQTALLLGDRFGVISIKQTSIPRHMRMVRALGIENRCAGDRAIDLSVVELSDENRTYARMRQVGAELRDRDGADVLVMGCAGMARYRDHLSAELGIPVVEPTQAAVALALGLSRLPWFRKIG
ncbi:MAG: aspartate/glutamate racemase family protein [Pseudomonadota bacterium]